MLRLVSTICLVTLCTTTYAQTTTIDFDDLPSLDFVVIEQPDGSTDIVFPDQVTVVTIPAGTPLELALPPGVTLQDLFPPPGEVPESAPLPSGYSPFATFSTDPGAGLHYFSGGHAVGSSAPNNITAAVNPDAFPYDENLYVDFVAPVNNLSFTVSSDNDSGKIATVRAFYAGSLSVELDVLGNGDPTDAIDVDLSGYQDVTRIEVIDITDTYGLSYDDFKFSPNAIPEPATMSLLAVCLLVAGLRRRT